MSLPVPVVSQPSTTVKPTPDHPYPIPSYGTEDILQMTMVVPQNIDVTQEGFKKDIRNKLEAVYLDGLKGGSRRMKRSPMIDEILHGDAYPLSTKLQVSMNEGILDEKLGMSASSNGLSNIWESFVRHFWSLMVSSDKLQNVGYHSRRRRQTVDPSNTTEVMVSTLRCFKCFLNFFIILNCFFVKICFLNQFM